MTFAQDIEAAAGDEPIEAVTYRPDRSPGGSWAGPIGPIPWEEARAALDFNYHSGFGSSDCYPVWAWTPSRVLFVAVYDGATWIEFVPRNPQKGRGNGFPRLPCRVGGE